jgi:uncharacterized protein YndB with AHSA1/START domain
MKKALLWIFYGFLGLFLVAVGGGFALPGEVTVARSAVMAAPPAEVFAVVSDLNRSKDWTPWMALDPKMKVEITGPAGIGQKLTWSSDDPNVGKGTQETVGFEQDKQVVAALDFGDMGKATATVQLSPEGDGTKVTWMFNSKLNNIFERWLGLMFDRWIGADFEKGLSNLKAYVEKN